MIFADDLLWFGTCDFETNYNSRLRKNVVIGKQNHFLFRYLGLHLEENDSGITLGQMYYLENMKPIDSNYDNDGNPKRSITITNSKVVTNDCPKIARYCF